MERIVINETLKTKLEEILKSCSDYNNFSSSLKAYDYAELLNSIITVCPYCNIESIETIRKKDGTKGERADFDHFVRKNNTTENDLSCTNLVPSCKKCNSSYKGAKNLSNEIINPFLEDFDTSAEFSLDVTENSLEHLSESEILLKTISNNESLKRKASKTIEIFNLINRYNSDTTKKDLETFLNNLELYPEIKQKEINKLVKAEKNILKYFDEMENLEINKNRYGKLKKDIIKRYLKRSEYDNF